ncbi:MAG TPA: ATP-binding protein [Candidatus Lumbricidophila sp.]|nr:ATP-binding protein [Candidatus Lumbricidophila sp.]
MTTTRRSWTLQQRLVGGLLAVLASVSLIVGVVSVGVFYAQSMAGAESSLREAMQRATLAYRSQIWPTAGDTAGILRSVGQSAGTLAAIVPDDAPPNAAYIAGVGSGVLPLPQSVATDLAAVPDDGRAHVIDPVPKLGQYLALVERQKDGSNSAVVLAIPLTRVNNDAVTLAITITCVALFAIALAWWFGRMLVARALVPLRRVTATAHDVSQLPLAHGSVSLPAGVVVTDPATEVGQLGTAFNRMLGHVASALTDRERSEQKVRRFVADASHELRTPLASIRGYAELTRTHGQELSEDSRRAIERIESESVRMTELVEDLLLLARLDEGRELRREPVVLNDMLHEVIADAQVAGPDHHWVADLPDAVVTVPGDEPRLRQVMVNLLANARTHTPSGTRVTVRLEQANGTARVTVTDTGPGIDVSVRDTLFERFVRADASRSRRAGSTGLGLAIVHGVVQAHHGAIHVQSEPGNTRFVVELPLA